MERGRRITLISGDGEYLRDIEEADLGSSVFFSTICETNADTDTEIPVPNVDSRILGRVIEFMRRHRKEPLQEIPRPLRSEDLRENVSPEWCHEYIMSFEEMDDLYALIRAAHYLDIAALQDLGCARIASMIHSKDPEEMRQLLGL